MMKACFPRSGALHLVLGVPMQLLRIGQVVAIWAGICVLVVCLTAVSRAGTATATAHSHDYAPVFDLTSSPTSTHPTTAYVDTGSVDTSGAHSRAWAAAFLSGGTLRKSTGGEGWYTNGASPKHFYWYANAGTGTYYLTAPRGVVTVPVQVRILNSGNPEIVDIARPDQAPPEVGAYPSQGFFAEYNFGVDFSINSSTVIGPTADVNLDGVTDAADAQLVGSRIGQSGPGLIGDLNNDFAIDFEDVDIVIQNFGGQGFETTELLNGAARLSGPESGLPPLVTSGDLTDRFLLEQQPSPNPGQTRLAALLPETVISNIIQLPVNVPFTLNLDQVMHYNRPDPADEDPPAFPVPDGLVASVSGALVSEISLPEIPGIQAFGIRAVPPGVPGDTNFDGQVDIKDLNNVRNNFGTGGPAVLGDTNGDGKINIEDLNMVRNNFGAGVNPAPEPGTLMLAGLAAVMLWFRLPARGKSPSKQ